MQIKKEKRIIVIPYYVIDAFSNQLFHGNPAGVCILEKPLPEQTMQQIAFENNLAETAFVFQEEDILRLRWFTPKSEIDLCGHATLAAAFVWMNEVYPDCDKVSFETMSGTLTVNKAHDIYTMDFPRRMPKPIMIPMDLEEALGCSVLETHLSRDLIVVVESENTVQNMQPDISKLTSIKDVVGIAVTSKGTSCDFVSRFFAPNIGVAEDPVTGSSHSSLIPFWSKRLQKKHMTAKQLSPRGGTLHCKDLGSRVSIGGSAVCYAKGTLFL